MLSNHKSIKETSIDLSIEHNTATVKKKELKLSLFFPLSRANLSVFLSLETLIFLKDVWYVVLLGAVFSINHLFKFKLKLL